MPDLLLALKLALAGDVLDADVDRRHTAVDLVDRMESQTQVAQLAERFDARFRRQEVKQIAQRHPDVVEDHAEHRLPRRDIGRPPRIENLRQRLSRQRLAAKVLDALGRILVGDQRVTIELEKTLRRVRQNFNQTLVDALESLADLHEQGAPKLWHPLSGIDHVVTTDSVDHAGRGRQHSGRNRRVWKKAGDLAETSHRINLADDLPAVGDFQAPLLEDVSSLGGLILGEQNVALGDFDFHHFRRQHQTLFQRPVEHDREIFEGIDGRHCRSRLQYGS